MQQNENSLPEAFYLLVSDGQHDWQFRYYLLDVVRVFLCCTAIGIRAKFLTGKR